MAGRMIGTVRLDMAKVDARRLRLGLLRGELAERAGLHPNTMTRAAGGCGISVRTARQIAAALGLGLGSVVKDVGAEQSAKVESRRATWSRVVGGKRSKQAPDGVIGRQNCERQRRNAGHS